MKYKGTDVEVRLGDRVIVKGLFRNREGAVCYVPGQSSPHPQMENGTDFQWAVALDDGTNLIWVWVPEELHVSGRIKYISRGEPPIDRLRPVDDF